MPRYGHNMSVATWFTSVQCIAFTVLSSNGWADLLASRVSPFALEYVVSNRKVKPAGTQIPPSPSELPKSACILNGIYLGRCTSKCIYKENTCGRGLIRKRTRSSLMLTMKCHTITLPLGLYQRHAL